MRCPICDGRVEESRTGGRLGCTNDHCAAIILCVRMRPGATPQKETFEGGPIRTLDEALQELSSARADRDRAFSVLRRLGRPPEGHALLEWWETKATNGEHA